jgi:hypothetical protein
VGDCRHLTLVAGVNRVQVERLEALGDAPLDTRFRKIRPAFASLRHQAELQLHRRHSGAPLEPDVRHGQGVSS